jgi:hypothetical protein
MSGLKLLWEFMSVTMVSGVEVFLRIHVGICDVWGWSFSEKSCRCSCCLGLKCLCCVVWGWSFFENSCRFLCCLGWSFSAVLSEVEVSLRIHVGICAVWVETSLRSVRKVEGTRTTSKLRPPGKSKVCPRTDIRLETVNSTNCSRCFWKKSEHETLRTISCHRWGALVFSDLFRPPGTTLEFSWCRWRKFELEVAVSFHVVGEEVLAWSSS